MAICFTISEPILPAAPVIRMVRPLRSLPMASISTSILSRGRRSSISTSRIIWWRRFDLPSHHCAFGIIIILMPAAVSLSIISCISRNLSVTIGLTKRVLMFILSITDSSFSSYAKTSQPRRYLPIIFSSVVVKPLRIYWDGCSLRMDFAREIPPSLTPRMNTGVRISAEKVESYMYLTMIRIVHIIHIEMKSITTIASADTLQRSPSGNKVKRRQLSIKPRTSAPEMRMRSTNDE